MLSNIEGRRPSDAEIPGGLPPPGPRFPFPAESGNGGYPADSEAASLVTFPNWEPPFPAPFPGRIGKRGNGDFGFGDSYGAGAFLLRFSGCPLFLLGGPEGTEPELGEDFSSFRDVVNS
jgi:hypothetical protein